MTYMTWRRTLAYQESVALRHLPGRTCAPMQYNLHEYTALERERLRYQRERKAAYRARKKAETAA